MGDRQISFSEVFILIFLIVINFLDFFEVLPGDVDFTKKILSWLLLAYLLYRVSLTQLFFGVKNRFFDVSLIIAYFLLIAKNLVSYVYVSAEEANLLLPFYNFIISNSTAVEITSLYIGGALLIFLSLLMAFSLEVRFPSLMDVIHERGFTLTVRKKLERFIVTFLVLVFFFIVVFNLVMEWLAIAIDASLLVVAFFFYMFTLFRSHYRRLHTESFLYKVGDVGERFYESFVGLFHSRQRIFLGISGLLVLHLLTDVGNFMIPYLGGFKDILYFGHLGAGHSPLYVLFLKDAALAQTILQKFYVSWVYLFNIFGMLFLLILPAYIWYKLYQRMGFFVSNKKLCIFFVSVFIFLLAPVFKIKEMTAEGLVGVDIVTSQLSSGLNLPLIVLLSLLFGVLVYFLSFNHYIKERLMVLGIVLVNLFFGVYIFYFFESNASYYIETIKLLIFNLSKYFVAFYFVLFFIMLALFYIVGFVIFLLETKKEFMYIR